MYCVVAFLLTATPTYAILWHIKGLDHVSREDGPLVVVGALWCIGWSLAVGLTTVLLTIAWLVRRSRRGALALLAVWFSAVASLW
jgi:hypothetical protein